MSDTQRYARQLLVDKLGSSSQQSLSAAHVLIVGAGGLGSPVSLFLAGAGVGEITLVDDDVVSLSNLHRQVLFQESDIGQLKVDAAKQHLLSLNSEITINAIAQRLSIDNAQDLVDQATIVIDAADNFLVSYLLSDICFDLRIPLVSASVLTTHGYLGVFCGTVDKPAPSLRAIFPTPSTEANNCNTVGVTGPSVGIIGSYQAQEALKVIINSDAQLLGKLMTLDLWNYRQQIIDFRHSKEPVKIAKFVSLNELAENEVLLDVRSPGEYLNDPPSVLTEINNAINIPLNELEKRFGELDKAQGITCICKSGQRALNAAHQLLENGFQNVSVTSR